MAKKDDTAINNGTATQEASTTTTTTNLGTLTQQPVTRRKPGTTKLADGTIRTDY